MPFARVRKSCLLPQGVFKATNTESLQSRSFNDQLKSLRETGGPGQALSSGCDLSLSGLSAWPTNGLLLLETSLARIPALKFPEYSSMNLPLPDYRFQIGR